MQALPRPAADELGYLQLTRDGAVIASRGALENDEAAGRALAELVDVALRRKVMPADHQQQQVSRISVVYQDHCYVVCLANKRLHVVKKTLKAAAAAGH